jgi:group I intron endonuclease
MGYIYLVTNRLTRKQYVGQTLHEDIETRWNQHRRVCENMLGRHIVAAYKKYGIQNFDFKVICVCFDEACNDLESFYIKKFNTLAPNGYNLREGGKNSKHSEESKQLMSRNRKGKGLGYVTEEMCRQRSERFLGEKNPNFGKKLTEEEKQQRSESMKRIWQQKKTSGIGAHENTIKALQEGNAKRWASFRERNPKPFLKGRKQRVAKLDEYGNILEEFVSIEDAASKTSANAQIISAVCRGTKKHAGGFRWKYLDIEGSNIKRNNSTGEIYINKYGSGFVIRINKKTYKYSKWFKTLEEAIEQRDRCVIEMNK